MVQEIDGLDLDSESVRLLLKSVRRLASTQSSSRFASIFSRLQAQSKVPLVRRL